MAQDASRPDFWETRYRDRVTPWDAGGAPERFVDWARGLPRGRRVLVPGCGSAHEVRVLAEGGAHVLAIDFSTAAVALARERLGSLAHRVVEADFFHFDAGEGFDAVYERAFLCALPRHLWPAYGQRMAEVLQPGGQLSGYFFFDHNTRGPPFGTSEQTLYTLLGSAFSLERDEAVAGSLPMFEGKERWQQWRRRDTDAARPSGPATLHGMSRR
ncbi:MAG: methyltransferase domain-containing protein [Betaproteobacteria bacterium]